MDTEETSTEIVKQYPFLAARPINLRTGLPEGVRIFSKTNDFRWRKLHEKEPSGFMGPRPVFKAEDGQRYCLQQWHESGDKAKGEWKDISAGTESS